MAATPRRRATRATHDLDPLGRPAVNPGGPPSDDDRRDAEALLAPLRIGDSDRYAALCAARLGDHTMPGYDPDRIVRILTHCATR
jgi:hypothetical protein